MTEIHERRVSHKELTLLEFQCPHCKSEMTLDLTNTAHIEKLQSFASGGQMGCTFCDHSFDSQFCTALAQFRHWFMALEAMNRKVTFRVPIAAPDANRAL